MSDNQIEEIFAERISNVSHANGVFRITLGENEDGNNSRPVVRLLVPANQLGPMIQGIANAARNIGEQIQFNADGGSKDGKQDAQKTKAKTTAPRQTKAKAAAKPKRKK